jgi:hypothetical protein
MSDEESVLLETSLGDIQLELYWNHAPKVRSYWIIEGLLTAVANDVTLVDL